MIPPGGRLQTVLFVAAAGCIVLIFSSAQNAMPQIVLKGPASREVRGPVTLTVDAGSIAGATTLEITVNGRPLELPEEQSRRAHDPWTVVWNTAGLWDGTYTLQAIARDESGDVIQVSPEMSLTVANHASATSIRMLQPAGGEAVSGRVEWVVSADVRSQDQLFWTFYINGDQQGEPVYTASPEARITVDTRQLRNGAHDWLCTLRSEHRQRDDVLGFVSRKVVSSNGRIPMQLRANLASVHVAVNDRQQLQPRLVYADGSTQVIQAQFSSADPSVASVSADGYVKGLAPGRTAVQIRTNDFTHTIPVTVQRPGAGFPHFSSSGRILTQYRPGESLFLRTMFFLDDQELRIVPGLADAVRSAGINALTCGSYTNPADGAEPDRDQWKREQSERMQEMARTLGPPGLNVFFTGDDFVRTPAELAHSVSGPDAEDRIRFAFAAMRDLKRSVAIDMMDETDLLWGDTPEPADGRWLTNDPPVDDRAFKRFAGIISRVASRPPVGWTLSGIASSEAVRNWQASAGYSDFATVFWSPLHSPAWPEAFSLPQTRQSIESVTSVRLPVLAPRSMPMLLLISATGPFYDKRGQSHSYTPGVDDLRQPGVNGQAVQAQIMSAVEMGFAGVRVYAYDSTDWKRERAESPAGTEELQTGIDPSKVGADRWNAMALALRLIAELEPVLLQPNASAPDLGASVMTAVKDGPNGTAWIATNLSEVTETLQVPLPLPMQKYVLTVRGVRRSTTAGADVVALEPGATVIYVSRKGGAG